MSDTAVNVCNIIVEDELNKAEDIKMPDSNVTNNGNCSGHKEGTETLASNVASYDLNKFQLQQILNNNTRNKSIALLGRFPDLSDTDRAIVIFEKKAFKESDVATITGNEQNENMEQVVSQESVDVELEKISYFGSDLKVQTEFINNIYGSYQCIPPPKLCGKSVVVVQTVRIMKCSNNVLFLLKLQELRQLLFIPLRLNI